MPNIIIAVSPLQTEQCHGICQRLRSRYRNLNVIQVATKQYYPFTHVQKLLARATPLTTKDLAFIKRNDSSFLGSEICDDNWFDDYVQTYWGVKPRDVVAMALPDSHLFMSIFNGGILSDEAYAVRLPRLRRAYLVASSGDIMPYPKERAS